MHTIAENDPVALRVTRLRRRELLDAEDLENGIIDLVTRIIVSDHLIDAAACKI